MTMDHGTCNIDVGCSINIQRTDGECDRHTRIDTYTIHTHTHIHVSAFKSAVARPFLLLRPPVLSRFFSLSRTRALPLFASRIPSVPVRLTSTSPSAPSRLYLHFFSRCYWGLFPDATVRFSLSLSLPPFLLSLSRCYSVSSFLFVSLFLCLTLVHLRFPFAARSVPCPYLPIYPISYTVSSCPPSLFFSFLVFFFCFS